MWRDRKGGEGLIKAEFFEQRRRITTRRTPGSFRRKRRGVKLGALPCLPAVLAADEEVAPTWSAKGSKSWRLRYCDTFREFFNIGNSKLPRGELN